MIEPTPSKAEMAAIGAELVIAESEGRLLIQDVDFWKAVARFREGCLDQAIRRCRSAEQEASEARRDANVLLFMFLLAALAAIVLAAGRMR